MCGIAGYWGAGSRDVLKRMGEAIAHRGPDDTGFFQSDQVGLVHRRLSILDLSPTGHQPMTSSRGAVTIVFNGEIYNYKELKKEFLGARTLRGSSDTEVLLHVYEALGEECISKLKGMFAFALYDAERGKLILARDHMGKKPLYWAHDGNTLLFGSELKALRAHPACPTAVDATAVAHYLVYEYVPGPRTIYSNVHKLMPGTYLVYDGKHTAIHTYDAPRSLQGSYTPVFDDAKAELDALLTTAVERRMVADVPVGIFLSGGLDSSAVTYVAQHATDHQVQTFSIGFDDPSFNESGYARDVAVALGTDHHERIVGPQDLKALIPKLPKVLDEPMADSSIIPTLLLSEYTRGAVTVALGGDGADELFAGYDTFFAHRMGLYYEKTPAFLRSAVKSAVDVLPVSHRYMSFDFKAKKFLSGFDTTRARRNTYWLSAFTPDELASVLTVAVDTDTVLAPTDALYGAHAGFWDSLQDEYLTRYLVEDILVKVDRASMAHSLEVRAPFLDIDLVRFALTLPMRYKQHGRTGKYILRELMKDRLPAHIIRRPKRGFNIPIGKWIQGELKDLFSETVLDGALVRCGLFKRAGLSTILESHLAGRQDNRKKLWTLLMLALWMDAWDDGKKLS